VVLYFAFVIIRETDLDRDVMVQVAVEMSLDEWKALQETSRSKSALNLRKADSEVPSKARVIHQSKLREVSTRVDSVAPSGGLRAH